MEITTLLKRVDNTEDCFLLPHSGIPCIPPEYSLPQDVREFYKHCGGVVLFEKSAYGIWIVSPQNFVRANPIIRGKEGEYDISYHWFIIGRSEEQYISIDLNNARLGRCYDSFWDRHAFPGNCPIIAKSFSDLLLNLLESHGRHWYWLDEKFKHLGDDEILFIEYDDDELNDVEVPMGSPEAVEFLNLIKGLKLI